MKALVCEMCGSQDLVKQNGMYVCQNCGTKYDPVEAKKLMIEVSGAVEVDNTKKVENYYQLARLAAKNNDYAAAAKYYDLIRQEDTDSWEAQFYAVYYSLFQIPFSQIGYAANLLIKTVSSVFMQLEATKENLEATNAIIEISNKTLDLFRMFASTEKNFYDNQINVDKFVIDVYLTSHVQSLFAGLVSLADLLLHAKDILAALAKQPNDALNKFVPLSINIRKEANKILADGWNTYYGETKISDKRDAILEMAKKQTEIIQKSEPEYKQPTFYVKSGGCYVATAVYGEYNCPPVWTLRRYRDYTLASSWYGRAFIRAYYTVSPVLVKWFGNTAWFKNMWRPILDRMVERLNKDGVADTPYQD